MIRELPLKLFLAMFPEYSDNPVFSVLDIDDNRYLVRYDDERLDLGIEIGYREDDWVIK